MTTQKRRTRKKEDGNINFIESLNLRNVTYCKRKRGFIKKAMELSVLCGQKISLLIYDERKNKMVSYHTTGFEPEEACSILRKHRQMKNKKLEVYSEENYDHFVVNPSIEEHNNPFLIFNVENATRDSHALRSEITANQTDSSKNEQLDVQSKEETVSFKEKNSNSPVLNQFSLQTTTDEDYKSIFKSAVEPPISKVEEQFNHVNKKLIDLA